MTQKLKAVQYHPEYCEEAKKDAEENGWRPWRWDSSHDLSVIDEEGVRHYIGQYRGAAAAANAGKEIERTGVIPETVTTHPPTDYDLYPSDILISAADDEFILPKLHVEKPTKGFRNGHPTRTRKGRK